MNVLFARMAVAVAGMTLLTACTTVHTTRQGPVDSGLPQRETASQSDPSDSQRRAAIRLQLAVGYFQQRQFEVALDEIRQALQADPDMADAYSVRGLIHMEMGDSRLAEEDFNRALQLSPANPEYLNNYGWFLCKTGREKRALELFDAVLQNRTYQSPSKALTNAGVCSAKLKDYARAEKYLLRSFQYDPGSIATNLQLADVYYQMQNDERARFYISRVIRTDAATAESLWLAIKVEHRLGDRAAEASLGTQLRRRYPNSAQYAAYQRGAYHE